MKLASAFGALAIGCSVALAGTAPAEAGPLHLPKAAEAQSNLVLAQYATRNTRDGVVIEDYSGSGVAPPPGSGRVIIRRGGGGAPPNRVIRRGGGGWVAPFVGGAIVGGLLAAPSYRYYDAPYYDPYYHRPPPRTYTRRVVPSTSAHVQWCYDRYRSYRAWDNSWQPYHGPRRQCRSPYG
jgi:hypothetical protein